MVHGSIVGVSWANFGPSDCELGGRRPSNQTVGQNNEGCIHLGTHRPVSIGLPFQSCFVVPPSSHIESRVQALAYERGPVACKSRTSV
jgi:hypothetical protein